MESLTAKILRRSKERREVICIHEQEGDDAFWAVIIEDFNDEVAVYTIYDSCGEDDGIQIRPLHRIGKLRYDDDYARALNYLVNSSTQKVQVETKIVLHPSEDWQFFILNQLTEDSRIIITADTVNFAYTGYVSDLSEEQIGIRIISNIGEDDGVTIIPLEDITFITLNNKENLKRQKLYNWTKSL